MTISCFYAFTAGLMEKFIIFALEPINLLTDLFPGSHQRERCR